MEIKSVADGPESPCTRNRYRRAFSTAQADTTTNGRPDMTYSKVMIAKDHNCVAELTLNRPDQLNALDSPMAEELYAALMELDADAQVRVVLLKGAGKAFCAGIDVNELAGKSALEYRVWIERMERPLVAISRMKKPVIAQVHGVAAANGMGIAAAADLVIAADNAWG
jgi:enoyl-CoA hydratase/carnithine racemase